MQKFSRISFSLIFSIREYSENKVTAKLTQSTVSYKHFLSMVLIAYLTSYSTADFRSIRACILNFFHSELIVRYSFN